MRTKVRVLAAKYIGILGGIMMLFSLFTGCASYDIAQTESFEYRYSTGNAMYQDVAYKLQLENGIYTATVKPQGVANEQADTFVVDEAFVQKLETILITNNVQTWNGFQKSDKRVLDGYDFDLHMRNQNGQSLSASGYMKWPKHYDEVKHALDELFMSLYPAKRADV